MARVKPSATSASLALASALKAQGRDVIGLGAGEPDFDTPEHIKAAAMQAIKDGYTKYTPVDGSAELKAAIQRKFQRENQLEYAPSQILVSSGAKQSLFNLCLGLLGPGDEAIIPAPYWVSYPDMVGLADAAPVIINTGIDDDFKITPAKLEAAITNKTRLLILNSPSNPTGACYASDELQALGTVLEQHPKVVVVADDIYEHIHWADEAFSSFATACPGLYDRVVTINGVSKAYAMTGWRIGYAAGPDALIKAMHTIQSQSTSNPCSISQQAAIAALDGNQGPVKTMCAAYRRRHDYIVDALNALPGIRCRPGEGTFYAFPSIEAAMRATGHATDAEFVEWLLNAADIACVPGSAFGAAGYLRISYACSQETLAEAVNRMKRALPA
ncbi:MAG: pyridoxal phosphate-dependent aminotransferase [Woeseiaceae bacterium]|nr:pyridoxal phosphate-dependent aminotransferase [Woeseiaceae bacterium]